MRLENTILSPYYIAKKSLLAKIKEASKYAKGNLLDIGCGDKPYAHLFKVKKYVGIDIPVEESANKNQKKADIYFKVPPIPVPDKSYDTILCNEVLEHIQEPDKLFKEMARVLKKGGHLILTTPMFWGLHEEPFDFYRFTKYGLSYLAEKNGFKVIYTKPTTGTFATCGQRISSFIFNIGCKTGILKYPTMLLCSLLQTIFILLDIVFLHKGDTLDNILVAEKK